MSGLFVAGRPGGDGDQFVGRYGAVIAGDECDPVRSLVDANIIKNPSVYFDPNGYRRSPTS